jgi:hypothetical protein
VIGDRWGVTPDEIARRYPCDDLVESPVLQAWRGVTVRAAPDLVWPWIVQIRLGPYSYDWIDNLGHRSPRERRDLPEPAPGQPFTTAAGRRLGRVLSVTPSQQLTARIMGATISYVLVPQGETTRLLMKIVAARGRWYAPLLSVGDLVMARRQLLNLKRLAERSVDPVGQLGVEHA